MDTRSQSAATRPRRRRWAFRIIAILIGLSPFLIAELSLRAVRWPPASELEDPHIGFSSHSDLFQRNDDRQRWEIAPQRQEFFRPDGFSVAKADNEFRIFCLGGSTVQGRPYQIETSFTTWLELSLKAAQPEIQWRVVNCGGVSYASYRLIPILEEVLGHDPDLIILYTGHNEFLEDRTYADFINSHSIRGWTHQVASHSAVYRAARHSWLKATSQPHHREPAEILHHEVQARLDFERGLDQFVRDDRWTEAVIDHYELNLERMVRLTLDADVPLLLCNPVSNLRTCRPFKSVHQERISNSDAAKVQSAIAAFKADVGTYEVKEEALADAISIDDRYALSHYYMGACYDGWGEAQRAAYFYRIARDEDICKLRMTTAMHIRLARVAQRNHLDLVDVRQLIASRSPDGIPDSTWLLDHVHPTIPGHQLIAELLFERIEELGLVDPRNGWETQRDHVFQEHTDSLEFAYYEHGRQRLEGLYRWTQGKAYGALPESEKVPPRPNR